MDRIEADQVVCETQDRSMEVYARQEMPEGICEGDVLIRCKERFVVDTEATEQRRKQVQNLFHRLKKK